MYILDGSFCSFHRKGDLRVKPLAQPKIATFTELLWSPVKVDDAAIQFSSQYVVLRVFQRDHGIRLCVHKI